MADKRRCCWKNHPGESKCGRWQAVNSGDVHGSMSLSDHDSPSLFPSVPPTRPASLRGPRSGCEREAEAASDCGGFRNTTMRMMQACDGGGGVGVALVHLHHLVVWYLSSLWPTRHSSIRVPALATQLRRSSSGDSMEAKRRGLSSSCDVMSHWWSKSRRHQRSLLWSLVRVNNTTDTNSHWFPLLFFFLDFRKFSW